MGGRVDAQANETAAKGVKAGEQSKAGNRSWRQGTEVVGQGWWDRGGGGGWLRAVRADSHVPLSQNPPLVAAADIDNKVRPTVRSRFVDPGQGQHARVDLSLSGK